MAGSARAGGDAAAPHATQLTGEYWAQLRPTEKQAYLTGFITGAAAEQVRARAAAEGHAGDSAAASSGAVSALRARRALQFRFAAAVYSSQVDDFYWWENHVPIPIMDVVIRLNQDMLKQQGSAEP
jgi:hypothetical protein